MLLLKIIGAFTINSKFNIVVAALETLTISI